MIAVPFAPTASVARHDDHRTDANHDRWLGLRTRSNALEDMTYHSRHSLIARFMVEQQLSRIRKNSKQECRYFTRGRRSRDRVWQCERVASCRAEGVRTPRTQNAPANARRRFWICRSRAWSRSCRRRSANDLRAPHVLLRRVAVFDRGSEPIHVGGRNGKGDAGAHHRKLRLGRVSQPRDRGDEGRLGAVSDKPMLNALLNSASGATWVSLHHGGGGGMGFSQHAGVVIVCWLDLPSLG